MRTKHYSFLFATAFAVSAFAQGSIPNPGFEQWDSTAYDVPQYYQQTSNPNTVSKCKGPFNCVKVSDAYHGNAAIKLTTVGDGQDACFGYFVNGTPDGPPTNNWPGGTPYGQQPTGIRGYYKCDVAPGDTARILVYFKKSGVAIGAYVFPIYGKQTTYTLFNFAFTTPLALVPDSLIFAATSSDFTSNTAVNGSMLQLDSLSFVGASQPLEFNGDFELWQSVSTISPAGWLLHTNDQGAGVSRTTDAHSGKYALELKTFTENENSGPRARSGAVSTGDCAGNGMCVWVGGYPFANQKDTLSFYYKYAPNGTGGKAHVDVLFKKNGVQFNGFGQDLDATSNYTYVQVPFNLIQTPDTVILEIKSNRWEDSLATFDGSDLKIDDLSFKSSTLSVPVIAGGKSISVFPNPSSTGTFYINGINSSCQIQVVNLLGEVVAIQVSRTNSSATIQFPDGSSGVYILNLYSNTETRVQRITISN